MKYWPDACLRSVLERAAEHFHMRMLNRALDPSVKEQIQSLRNSDECKPVLDMQACSRTRRTCTTPVHTQDQKQSSHIPISLMLAAGTATCFYRPRGRPESRPSYTNSAQAPVCLTTLPCSHECFHIWHATSSVESRSQPQGSVEEMIE